MDGDRAPSARSPSRLVAFGGGRPLGWFVFGGATLGFLGGAVFVSDAANDALRNL
ncbi:hypothetical protein [Streptomyces sp. ME19-01-6]|uniref:hypothetical protein n=1 Tax=Streptomyces sp. ME19-01-6 TaxID=3028686 RepID=UPI0029AB1A58|nr:hypothetical protein [Streptomyces sp. ME19-01-6]MDX3226220.1 hypothetical protein [Streptomyces sp. ME19-01-6]